MIYYISDMTCQLEICCLYNEPLRRNSIYIYQYCMWPLGSIKDHYSCCHCQITNIYYYTMRTIWMLIMWGCVWYYNKTIYNWLISYQVNLHGLELVHSNMLFMYSYIAKTKLLKQLIYCLAQLQHSKKLLVVSINLLYTMSHITSRNNVSSLKYIELCYIMFQILLQLQYIAALTLQSSVKEH